eukprot:1910963-Lingulodinium_polyedra.AAC.1
MRARAISCITRYVADAQMGGLASRGTDCGSHHVRACLQIAQRQGVSVAILFVDLVAAFYN